MIAKHSPDYPFAKVRERLRGADLAIFNLECALSRDGIPIRKRYSFKADPGAAQGLVGAGLDIAVLANNHSVDCGREQLSKTIEVLRRGGIASVGAGSDSAAAMAPLMVERDGLRIAVLARSFVLPDRVIYREDAPTVAMYDPETMMEEVREARQQADVVIISLHWGIEYSREPQESQRRIAHALVDAGATLVLGHHPHTPPTCGALSKRVDRLQPWQFRLRPDWPERAARPTAQLHPYAGRRAELHSHTRQDHRRPAPTGVGRTRSHEFATEANSSHFPCPLFRQRVDTTGCHQGEVFRV